MKITTRFIYISIFWLLASTLQAASLYVTDRILLGVHQQPSEDSPIVESIPSGTAVQLIEKKSGFSHVKLVDGVEGWVSSQYLMAEQPSTAQYDKLLAEHKKSQESLKAVNATRLKHEKDVQLLRDELSNAKTTIRELQKGGKVVTQADPKQAEELQAARDRIVELTSQVEKLQASQAQPVEGNDLAATLKYAEEENDALRARIELALSNLSGEKAPSPEELAGIRPKYPLWYWLLMLVALAIGIGGGIAWMDYQVRKRHGGFRI